VRNETDHILESTVAKPPGMGAIPGTSGVTSHERRYSSSRRIAQSARNTYSEHHVEWACQRGSIQPWPSSGQTKRAAGFAEYVGQFSKTRDDVNTWFDAVELDDYASFGGKV
jgi:hypothetical protein